MSTNLSPMAAANKVAIKGTKAGAGGNKVSGFSFDLKNMGNNSTRPLQALFNQT